MTTEGGWEGVALSRLLNQLFPDTKALLHLFLTSHDSGRTRKSNIPS